MGDSTLKRKSFSGQFFLTGNDDNRATAAVLCGLTQVGKVAEPEMPSQNLRFDQTQLILRSEMVISQIQLKIM